MPSQPRHMPAPNGVADRCVAPLAGPIAIVAGASPCPAKAKAKARIKTNARGRWSKRRRITASIGLKRLSFKGPFAAVGEHIGVRTPHNDGGSIGGPSVVFG